MSIPKMASIVQKLSNLTARGKIEWEQTEKQDVFQTSLSKFSIRIYRQFSQSESEYDYFVSILDSAGNALETVCDLDLVAYFPVPEAFKIMRDLHQSARGYALGVEQSLDTLANALDEKNDDLPF